MQNISAYVLLAVSSFFVSCSFLKVVPPDFPDGLDCVLIWNEIKDENGVVDKLKTFEASYGICSKVREPEKQTRVPLEQAAKENYAARKLDYDVEIGKWIDKANSRLQRCADEGEPP